MKPKKKKAAKKLPPEEQLQAELLANANLKAERYVQAVQAEAEAQNANLVHKASGHAKPPHSSTLDIANDLRQEVKAKKNNTTSLPTDRGDIKFPGAPQIKLASEVTMEEAEAFTSDQRTRLHALLTQRAKVLQEEIVQFEEALEQRRAQARAQMDQETLS